MALAARLLGRSSLFKTICRPFSSTTPTLGGAVGVPQPPDPPLNLGKQNRQMPEIKVDGPITVEQLKEIEDPIIDMNAYTVLQIAQDTNDEGLGVERILPELKEGEYEKLLNVAGIAIPENYEYNQGEAFKLKFWPGIGNRDVVTFGYNGMPHHYYDEPDNPFPGVRFKEWTMETLALREKEFGDWHNMTLEEKKKLYRHNFQRNIEECDDYHWEFYAQVGGFIWFWFVFSSVYEHYGSVFYFEEKPIHLITNTEKYEAVMNGIHIQKMANPDSGIASMWDYTTGYWKGERKPDDYKPNPNILEQD